MNQNELSSILNNNSQNCQTGGIGGAASGGLTWASQMYTPLNTYTNYPVQIRKVENGFILWNGTQEYVFSNMKKLVEFLEKQDIK